MVFVKLISTYPDEQIEPKFFLTYKLTYKGDTAHRILSNLDMMCIDVS